MNIYECSELVREQYALIGSGDQGYIPKAIHCAIKTLNDITVDQSVPMEVRKQAAFAAANLLISDHEDK
ncbi:YaeP family protein [Thalassotalea aquiviva]|uniref:YaeP family protein n=1 Tax=Thalassotalea aquiviva TaxID=3242415 RepID=UPI00352A6B25